MKTIMASSLTSNKKATLTEVDEKIAEYLNDTSIGRNKKRLTDHMKAINELRDNVQTLAKEIEDIHTTNEVHNHISETIGKSKRCVR